MSLSAGTRLGPYHVVSPLGAGGMGEVYRATDTKLGREVAIKVLPAALAQDADRLARFEREARLLAALNHPNIAHVYGFEHATLEDGSTTHFLAMELVPGEDLAQRLTRGPIPVAEALAIATQIAEALEQAHEKGIVHRDLKPANVTVTPDGRVKVLDFGLAKAWEGPGDAATDPSHSPTLAHTGTAAGLILGTAAYMSPEQARGRPADKRADIWAFGVVLYEMLTGRQLFAGETVSDTLAAILKEEPRWDELPAALPAGARHVLRRCLARDPRARLHDIADARIELGEVTREEDRPNGRAADSHAPGPRWRRWGAWGAVLLVGASLGAAAARIGGRSPQPPQLRFTVTPPGASGVIQVVRLSRDGRRLVYSLSSERRLLRHDLDAFDSVPIPVTERGSRPFLSPDGRWVGFFQDGKIRKVALDGGDAIDICDAPEDSAGAAWGPGDVILFNRAWTGSGLWRVDAAGGTPTELTKPARDAGETGHFWADFLPDGRTALFTIFGGQGLADSKVGLLDLESGRYEALFDGAAPRYLASGHILFYKRGAYRAVWFDAKRRRASGPETTVLREVRRLSPVGSPESYLSFSDTGVLAYVRGDSTLGEPPSRLVWVNREGRRQDLSFEGNSGDFRLSPDGTRAAIVLFANGQSQIHVHDLERGTTEQLTRDGQNFDPAWHPDGRRVAFTSQLSGSFDLRWAPADGSAAPAPLIATAADEGSWSWAPDGESGVFQVWSPVSGRDLWRASGSGEGPRPLVASPRPDTDAAFSPDGKWLAYTSDGALYVSPYPSLGQRVLIASAASRPRWSGSTGELFFIAERRLAAVTYTAAGGVFRAGTVETIFDLGGLGEAFEVAPDGTRFLFLAPTAEDWRRDTIRVVTGGLDLLRAETARE